MNLNENVELTNVKEIYEIIAKHFNSTRNYTWKWINDFLNSLPNGSIVYDLGCGNGRNMMNKNINFIGIDNCNNFIEICKNKNLNVINSNIINIPLPDNSADAIICIATFHHLYTHENRLASLNEMKRLIKPNCKILLSVWSINQPKKTRKIFTKYGNNIVTWNSYGRIYERYYYIFKFKEIKKLFLDVGLNVISYKYDCGNEIFILTKLEL